MAEGERTIFLCGFLRKSGSFASLRQAQGRPHSKELSLSPIPKSLTLALALAAVFFT
jgi:hypothetical protein